MENKIYDILIVGSGPSGVMAAETLVNAGKQVLMLDVGEKDEKYSQIVPNENFIKIRREDKEQHRYFLGDEFESIPWSDIKVGAQLTPSRKSMIRNVSLLTPLISNTFLPMESLGYGGLGAGWGLGAYRYSDAELKKAGLSEVKMKSAYQTIANRIGISCGKDDVSPYIIGDLENIQAPLKMDNGIEKMMRKYSKKRSVFRKNDIYLGAASMAFLSENKEERKACEYRDLDFYSDEDKSAWRAQFSIEELLKRENFQYISGKLVLSYKEVNQIVEVEVWNTVSKLIEVFKCNKLVMAAGALGTGRIVLRSTKEVEKLPILCNPYIYMPCIQPSMFGKALSVEKTSMAQAMMIYDPTKKHDDLVSVALFTYRSLMLFKLIKEAPLNFSDGRFLFQHLQSSFLIAGIHHPDEYSENKYLKLIPNENSPSKDALFVEFQLNEIEKSRIIQREKAIRKSLRSLGVYPLKRLDPGFGGSIHYAGTVPFGNSDSFGTSAKSGRINQTKNVYIADGSSFSYLPAKGITLSLMANAHRVATNIIENNE